jgi:hypothetical protein
LETGSLMFLTKQGTDLMGVWKNRPLAGLSFDRNLCYRCPNGSCKAILDIYTLKTFQRYKKRLNARCFDPCNHALSFWESLRTPKSHFRECEWRPHNSFKVGLWHHSLKRELLTSGS